MWKDFDLSMISADMDAVIWVPDQENASVLIHELYSHGIRWCGPSTKNNTNWDAYKAETCYFVERGEIAYADREYVRREGYDVNKTFVFMGDVGCEINPVSESEILQMLS